MADISSPVKVLGAASDFMFKMLLLTAVLSMLPASPFNYINELLVDIPFLSYINWFIPIAEITAFFELWLSCVLIYYGYMFVLRWANGLKGS